MEQTYTTPKKICKLVTTRPEKLQFIMDYSRALDVVKCQGLIFENNQN